MSLMVFAPVGASLALIFAAFYTYTIFKVDEGTDRMKYIAESIRKGSNAFLKRQYKGVGIFFIIMFIILFILAQFNFVSIFMPFAFLTGGVFSGLSGYLGMKIATNSNSRTANACTKSLNSGLRVAFSSGSVMGLVVVGLALADLSIWYFILNWYYGSMAIPKSPILKLLNPPDATKLINIEQPIIITGAAVDFIPTDKPVIITVAGPVFDDSAILFVGL